jgi:hypothetical protein
VIRDRAYELEPGRWAIPVTGRLVDAYQAYLSLEMDLRSVGALLPKAYREGNITGPVWVAALTLYSRCFTEGRRRGLANQAVPPEAARRTTATTSAGGPAAWGTPSVS